MVPKGWTLLQVSDICKLQNGNSFKPHEWDTQGLPIIRIQNLNGSDNYNYFSGVPQDKWLVEPGQLLFSWAGTKGVSFGPFIWNGPKGVLNQHIYKVFANENVHGHWLYLALLHITQKIEAQAHGFKSTLLHVQKKDIDNQFVLTPPVAEQKKMAQILSTWDKAISVTEKLLTNSQQQKKALMQQLLTGNKRLLDENGVRFSGEWKITKLIQMGKVVSGGTPDTNMAMYWEGDILWLTPTDVTALTGRFVSNTSRKITPAGLLNSSAVLLPKGSLMVCTRATIGALAISTSEICTNQGFKNIIPNEGFNIEFIYYLLQMNTNEMIKKSSGSTFLELSKKDFETLSFSCPFIKEQQKIAAVLSAADTEISTLEKKLACLRDEKKALMQQLLTGKRRVKVDEAVAE
ncbi:restriction endonuclease subunit S [Escherichia coli]|nr:restriction endonuclease subunit S [Escherichia coli]EFH4016172.1 restriction endonuclease subunit S [Escherichia coli]EFK8884152.1 restriction endonuclease subunit S [Escherichia coli]EFM4153183.1 restriction endonuclease subunit S [Escherichia coli]EJO0166886.1 restriction endonuclease subunit S [Escherichia coli]